LESLIRVLGLDGATVLHRQEEGWRIEATSGDRAPESPEAASTTIDLDGEHLLAVAGPPLRAEDERILKAFSKELASSVELGELEAEVAAVGALSATSELRSAILSAVSHDLRTPISAIKASVTSLLQDDIEWTPSERREFLDTIDEETDRLNALVGNLLDMSRLQAGALEITAGAVSLDEVLPAALHSLGLTDGAVDLDVPETLPRVSADRGLLERALANILQNAVRYSPDGQPARVTAGVIDGQLDVRVVDRGPGVRRDDRERVFMPFQRLGDSGTDEGVGLGLAVAKGFIEAMGGEIEIEDTPGGGLTVLTRLRIAG
jgi:two-component system sensor histidine kinase KdpD